jgi:bla regulator protein blaR1
LIPALEAFTGRLLEMSWQASLLICVVLVVRLLMGRRMPAQWRHALWLLVLLRLVLPWTPASRFSIYSVVPNPIQRASTGPPLIGEVAMPGRAVPASQERIGVTTVVWLIGAAGFAVWLLAQAVSTILAFHGRRPVTDKAILELLEDCKEELGISTYLAIVETPRTRAPALFGWIRPRLLLPPNLLDTLSQDRLRHVFLHELAHLKRHDIALNWLAAGAQALHWFNPLVWLAFQQARLDMELACDELALARLQDHESGDYGHTILDLLNTWAKPERLPSLAAITEDVNQVKRRIQMVAAFKKGQYVSSFVPVAILLVLGAVFMVDARSGAASSMASSPADPQSPPVDAAIKSATAWMALLDSGDCGQVWAETHTVVKGMISRETWAGMCTELRRLEAAERGAVVSRKAAQIEYIAGLPMGLGDGISIRFQSKYEKGEYSGPKILLAKDKDGAWRMVRSDKE